MADDPNPTQDEIDQVAKWLLADLDAEERQRFQLGRSSRVFVKPETDYGTRPGCREVTSSDQGNLSLESVRRAMDQILAAEPWRRLLGTVELKVTDMVPDGPHPVYIVTPPDLGLATRLKTIVLMRPHMREALETLLGGGGVRIPDDHLAAMIVWQLRKPKPRPPYLNLNGFLGNISS